MFILECSFLVIELMPCKDKQRYNGYDGELEKKNALMLLMFLKSNKAIIFYLRHLK